MVVNLGLLGDQKKWECQKRCAAIKEWTNYIMIVYRKILVWQLSNKDDKTLVKVILTYAKATRGTKE